jgi:excisionase family DNA binding protein
VSATNGGSRADALLTIPEAAARLGTPARFVRRLVAERRIGFTKVGRYVRLSHADLDAFIAAGRVDPLDREARRP